MMMMNTVEAITRQSIEPRKLGVQSKKEIKRPRAPDV